MASGRPIGRREAQALLAAHGITPRRSRGQNFLVDPNMAERIARLADVGPGDRVVEIGAGLGSLTMALAETGASVTSIEVDTRLAEVVRSLVPRHVRLVQADAMSCRWEELLETPDDPAARWTLVANLPYNVATPLIVDLLVRVPRITRMVVMVQAEVGARLTARAGDPAYGQPSVRVAFFSTAGVALRVPPDVFYPRPSVNSVIIDIERLASPAVPTDVASFEEVDELVRAAFSGRRKMLRRSLRELVTPAGFEAAGIDPSARAEQLDVVAWGKLAQWRRSLTSSHAPS